MERIKKLGLMTFKVIKAVSFQTDFKDVTPTRKFLHNAATHIHNYAVKHSRHHYEVKFTTQLLRVNVWIMLPCA